MEYIGVMGWSNFSTLNPQKRRFFGTAIKYDPASRLRRSRGCQNLFPIYQSSVGINAQPVFSLFSFSAFFIHHFSSFTGKGKNMFFGEVYIFL